MTEWSGGTNKQLYHDSKDSDNGKTPGNFTKHNSSQHSPKPLNTSLDPGRGIFINSLNRI